MNLATHAHRLRRRGRYWVRRSRLLQIAVVLGFWFAGEAIERMTSVPVPGGIVGMLMMVGLLATHRMNVASVRRGAEWYLSEMLLFFVPAVLAVVQHRELFGLLGLKILAIMVVGTASVMAITALVVEACFRWRSTG